MSIFENQNTFINCFQRIYTENIFQLGFGLQLKNFLLNSSKGLLHTDFNKIYNIALITDAVNPQQTGFLALSAFLNVELVGILH